MAPLKAALASWAASIDIIIYYYYYYYHHYYYYYYYYYYSGTISKACVILCT